MERFLLGELLVLRDVEPAAAGQPDHGYDDDDALHGAVRKLRMGGLPLRSLATFQLGGVGCRSGLADRDEAASVLGPDDDLRSFLPAGSPAHAVLGGTPVSVWRLPEWHVGDWTVVHLVLSAHDGAEISRDVHRELLGVLEVERPGSRPFPVGGTFGGDRVVQCTVEVPGSWSALSVSLQPLTRGGSLEEAVLL